MQLDEVSEPPPPEAQASLCPGGRAVGLPERSNRRGSKGRLDAGPLSLTARRTYSPTIANRTSTRPSRGVNLIALATRFHTTCWSRSGSPEMRAVFGLSPTSRRMPFASAAGRTESIAASIHPLQRDRPDVQSKLARDRARDVEEIVDQPRLQPGTSLDRFQGALRCRSVELPFTEKVRPVEDRRERSAELVGQDGEELVLGSIRGGQLVGQGCQVTALARERHLGGRRGRASA